MSCVVLCCAVLCCAVYDTYILLAICVSATAECHLSVPASQVSNVYDPCTCPSVLLARAVHPLLCACVARASLVRWLMLSTLMVELKVWPVSVTCLHQ